jgi:hypothetical protein
MCIDQNNSRIKKDKIIIVNELATMKVELLDGSSIDVEVEQNTNPEQLKQIIYERSHTVPPLYQQLFAGDKVLDRPLTEEDTHVKLKLKDDVNKILEIATKDDYNTKNNLKCNLLFIKQEQGDDYDVEIKLVGGGRWEIKTPFYTTLDETSHWVHCFVLLVFDEETKEFITATKIENNEPGILGEQLLLKPNEEMSARIKSVFLDNKLNTGKTRDLIFVATTIPKNEHFAKFHREILLKETDTFTLEFWKSAWNTITQETWSSKIGIISGVLKTSVAFKNNRMDLYNILLA